MNVNQASGTEVSFRQYEYTVNVEMLEETIQGPLLEF